jgi:hypothetical protein
MIEKPHTPAVLVILSEAKDLAVAHEKRATGRRGASWNASHTKALTGPGATLKSFTSV